MIPKEYLPKLDQLKSLYVLYDRVVGQTKTACTKGCAFCCTCNVTMTSLEAFYLFSLLDVGVNRTVLARLKERRPEFRYRPKVTTNGFAELCIKGQEPPLEENDPEWGRCPLLENDLCTIYMARPFGCRSLISDMVCRDSGHAGVTEFIFTCNTVFMQAIEHLDSRGLSGNLSDMLQHYGQERHLANNRLIENRKAPVFLVPPEHQKQIKPLMNDIARILK